MVDGIFVCQTIFNVKKHNVIHQRNCVHSREMDKLKSQSLYRSIEK